MRYLLLSFALMLALSNASLATKRSAPNELDEGERNHAKKNRINTEGRMLLEDLYKLITENPDQLRNSTIPEDLFKQINTEANQGNSRAQNNLGFMYQKGWQRADGSRQEPDPDKAVEWFTAAAQQGDASAQNKLGIMYNKGWQRADGSRQEPDLDKAAEWYTAAAKQGHAVAQNNLGFMLGKGWQRADGSRQNPDPDKAVEWLTAATKQKNANARNILSKLITWKPEQKDSNVIITPFSLSEPLTNYIESAIVQFEYWEALCNPDSQHKDTAPNPLVHSSAHKMREELQSFQTLLKFFEAPGFLTTSVKPRFNILEIASPESYLSAFNVRGHFYTCMGRDNIKAANQLSYLLERMQKHPKLGKLRTHFKSIQPYMIDEESKKNSEDMLNELSKIKQNLKEVSDELFDKIKIHAPRRNHLLEEMLGEQP